MPSAAFAAWADWLNQREAFAKARNIQVFIGDEAARAPIKVHKLRHDVSILEGAGANIAVLTGADVKLGPWIFVARQTQGTSHRGCRSCPNPSSLHSAPGLRSMFSIRRGNSHIVAIAARLRRRYACTKDNM